MRLFFISFIFISLAVKPLSAQDKAGADRFAEADARAAEVSKQFLYRPELLAQKLSEGMTNDYDKVRAFYTWIVRNIRYDLFAFTHHRTGGQNVQEVLVSGKALCLGYSLLFNFFCESVGIPSVIIEGYAKGYGYEKGQKFSQGNHAWNAVFIHGSWYLLDVTWATGDPTLHAHQRKINLDEHFLVDPNTFVLTHLPEDPTWQLLQDKVSLKEFETGKREDNETAIIDYFDPSDYDNLNEFDIELLQYKRSLQFNPKNAIFYERLSFAYVYKSINIIDNLYKLDFESHRDDLGTIDTEFYAYLDSALFVSENIEDWRLPNYREKLKDEINYQKGVFNYEVGTELFRKYFDGNTPDPEIRQKTKTYYELAKPFFLSVPETSIYFPSAREYLSNIDAYVERMLSSAN